MNEHQRGERAERPPTSEDELDFRLTVQEAELVLEALGAMRYSMVYRLIAKLQTQARDQVPAAAGEQVDLREVAGGRG